MIIQTVRIKSIEDTIEANQKEFNKEGGLLKYIELSNKAEAGGMEGFEIIKFGWMSMLFFSESMLRRMICEEHKKRVEEKSREYKTWYGSKLFKNVKKRYETIKITDHKELEKLNLWLERNDDLFVTQMDTKSPGNVMEYLPGFSQHCFLRMARELEICEELKIQDAINRLQTELSMFDWVISPEWKVEMFRKIKAETIFEGWQKACDTVREL